VPPEIDVCDGVDNDCNDQVDDPPAPPAGTFCGFGLGECSAGGILECVDGVILCTGVSPTVEICNGLDDDCDGFTDASVFSCGTTLGRCQPGKLQCQNGVAGDCVGAIGPSQEVCDGYDNDCDGLVDEADACP
jgi:hypothetical protein